MNSTDVQKMLKQPGLILPGEAGYIYTSLAPGLWEVKTMDGKIYMTDTENGSCTCKSFYYTKKPCKHLKHFMGDANV